MGVVPFEQGSSVLSHGDLHYMKILNDLDF